MSFLHLEWEKEKKRREAWIDTGTVQAVTEDDGWAVLHLAGSSIFVNLPAAEVVAAVEKAREAARGGLVEQKTIHARLDGGKEAP